ncbi:MAG: LysM peptidoglycan-binding domain-containing protein [Lachnospiraceae bacterium]|nr:LysM peptidoglycan-binding domain-containing protein [Lachnospiraceae bacterium]
MRKYVLILITIIIALMSTVLSLGNTKVRREHIYYKSVDITKSDTLWGIADTYKNENMSVTNYISLIKDFNDMESDVIKIGQKIILPIEVEE